MRFFKLILMMACFYGHFISAAQARIVIEGEEAQFKANAGKEIQAMRDGKRGLPCRVLIERLDISTVTTTVRPLTADENTWHPNDHRGTRSNLMPVDTKVRGAERSTPTAAVLYLHPNRVEPGLSLYRLGNFIYELASACDLNYGLFSADFKIRERRAVFFRNAWCDALGYGLISVSGRVPTADYQKAKEDGLITEEHSDEFPILQP